MHIFRYVLLSFFNKEKLSMFKFFQKWELGKKIRSLFSRKVDEEAIEELEKLFFEIDLGTEISSELAEKVRTLYRKNPEITSEAILLEIKKGLISTLGENPAPSLQQKPHVILIVGVNGNGKTTSIAKLANLYKEQGKKVIIGAGDTFRAAAIDQLEIWANRLGVEMVKGKPMSDPAAVAFDTIQAGKSRGADVVLIDTAGRLHTRTDLMKELEKIRRVMGKALEGAPHETFLVLDATVGQNALSQASIFHESTPLTGIILTKLDGTAKGGTTLAIQKKLKLPIRYIGVGEGLSDLKPFEAEAFVGSLFE
jgi:fused signal recognition particle receptor